VKPTFVLAILLLFSIILVSLLQIRVAKAEGTIYIRTDGSIEGTDKIQRDGNVYTLTGNINGSIVVEKNNITIDGNGYTLQAEIGTGIYLFGRESVAVRNIQIKTFGYGIMLNSSSNNRIKGNNITENHGDGVYLYSSNYNSISGNNITDNGNGIVLGSYSNYNSISENKIANNGFGINLWDSSNNSISGNNIAANRYAGIRLSYSSNHNSISGNNITNHSEGITLLSSSNNSLNENSITNNEFCIRMESYSSNNSIIGNNITNSDWGVYLHYSYNNIFYHNNFIGNRNYTLAGASTSVWDNGAEGNYWSDYKEKYTNATEIEDSGIWDTPYIIDGKNKDNYPLVNVIPEFPSWIILPLLITLTFAAIIYKKRLTKTQATNRNRSY
jgi:parallel beta-helix repeat protein